MALVNQNPHTIDSWTPQPTCDSTTCQADAKSGATPHLGAVICGVCSPIFPE